MSNIDELKLRAIGIKEEVNEGANTADRVGGLLYDIIDSMGGSGVQSDWNQGDSTQPDFIKNKPNIPSTTGLASEQYVRDYTYDKQTIDDKIAQGGTFDPTNYYTKREVDAANTAQDTEIAKKVNASALATVATSGSYNDLNNKPVIPEGVIVDTELSKTSTNPVQNKVITEALENVGGNPDKPYNPESHSGLGRKTLELKEDGSNVLTQEDFSDANTIYVVRYDFTLGETVTIPANCVLEFDGGSISASGSNDTITGTNTGISAGLIKILDTDITLAGTWNVAEAYPEWFGAKGDGVTDDLISLQKTFDIFYKIRLLNKTYTVSNSLFINKNRTEIKGNASIINITADTDLIVLKKDARCISIYDISLKNIATTRNTGVGIRFNNANGGQGNIINNCYIQDFNIGITGGNIMWDNTFRNTRISLCNTLLSIKGESNLKNAFYCCYFDRPRTGFCVDIEGCTETTFDSCNFGADIEGGRYVQSYSNSRNTVFKGCNFENCTLNANKQNAFNFGSWGSTTFDNCWINVVNLNGSGFDSTILLVTDHHSVDIKNQIFSNISDVKFYISTGTASCKVIIDKITQDRIPFSKLYENTAGSIVYLVSKTELDVKVDKEDGKGLSTNDYTNEDKQKVSEAITQHQDISRKADKSEMIITPGTGVNVDKTIIQLKEGTNATVLTQHQDISGKANVSSLQELETQINNKLNGQDQAISNLNGSEVIVVEDHTAVQNPNTQKIYREYGTNSYTDWMCTDNTTTPATWHDIATYDYPGVDDIPTDDSNKFVKSGGVKAELNKIKYGERVDLVADETIGSKYIFKRGVLTNGYQDYSLLKYDISDLSDIISLRSNSIENESVYAYAIHDANGNALSYPLDAENIIAKKEFTIDLSTLTGYKWLYVAAPATFVKNIKKSDIQKLNEKVESLNTDVEDFKESNRILREVTYSDAIKLNLLLSSTYNTFVICGNGGAFYEITKGSSVSITAKSNQATAFAFLDTLPTEVEGTPADYMEGEGLHNISAGESSSAVAPANGYLYIQNKVWGTDKFPDEVIISYIGVPYLESEINNIIHSKFTETNNILWLGTSIPEGAKYPKEASKKCGYNCINRALGSSSLCALASHPSTLNYASGRRLSMTVDEIEAMFRPDVTSGAIIEDQLTEWKNSSYEVRLLPYINGTNATQVSMIVIDHGFNDRFTIHNQMQNVQDINWNSTDRTIFTGAMRYLINKITEINPFIKIVIAGYFQNTYNHTDYYADDICNMQELIAKHYSISIMKAWEHSQINNSYVEGTSNYLTEFNQRYGTSYTPYSPDSHGNILSMQLYCPDMVHPHSDKSGNCDNRLNAVYSKLLKDLI